MLLISALMFCAIWLMLKRTRVGLVIQAALTHPEMVGALGHNVPRVFTIVFAGGSALAGLAGVIGGNYLVTEPSMAFTMGPIVFVVVVFGGLGSLAGCFIASLIMGFVQTFAVVLDYSPADLLARFGITVTAATPVRRVPDDPAAPDRRAAPVPDARPHPALQAARPDGHARHMSESALDTAAPARTASGAAALLRRHWPWLLALAVALVLPWLFFDWARARHSGFVVLMLSQMGMMIVFALSYNMQMGQAGLLSFGHAVFFGLGAYCTAHALNAIKAGGFWLPFELVPLVGGLGGLGFAIVFGYIATKQRATAFAMITLGIGELVTAAALMFRTFFGGEGGVSTNRVVGTSLFGLNYGPAIQLYYLIVAWTVVAVVLMLLLTKTPLGRMANACRDNFERAQFVGYDPRMVRFFQFTLSGLFAGLAGALYAMTYEIVTYDAVGGALSANALLDDVHRRRRRLRRAHPGRGADRAAAELGEPAVATRGCVYVGVLFILMVTFAPGGLAGLDPRPRADLAKRARRAPRRARTRGSSCRGCSWPFGFVLLVELCSFLTIGAAQGKAFKLSARDHRSAFRPAVARGRAGAGGRGPLALAGGRGSSTPRGPG